MKLKDEETQKQQEVTREQCDLTLWVVCNAAEWAAVMQESWDAFSVSWERRNLH